MVFRDFSRFLWASLVAALLVGCGGYKPPSGVVVKGKVTKGGTPLTVPNMDTKAGYIKVELFPVFTDPNDQRQAEGTTSGTDGTFEVKGGGKGILPGKYKVSIFADPGDGVNQLGDKFTGENSPIQVDIAESNLGSTQDLGTLEIDSYK